VFGGGRVEGLPSVRVYHHNCVCSWAPQVLKGSRNKRNKVEGIRRIYIYRDLLDRNVDYNPII